MTLARSLLLAAAALAVLLVRPPQARAADVQVNPVVVELSAAAPSAIVALRNVGKEAVRFEVQVRTWSQNEAGEMELASTDDVVAYPPVVELAPGEQRNLRVGGATPLGPLEKSYRLFIKELPPPPRPGAGSQVRVISRIGLPVFVAPLKVVEGAAVEDLAVRGGRVTFTLRNTGTVRVRPTSVKVVGTSGRAVLLERGLTAWYVLAGGVRRYELELPRETCARVREVGVEVAMDRGPLRARLAVPAGACGR
jgi:fimbrial chaperone protein